MYLFTSYLTAFRFGLKWYPFIIDRFFKKAFLYLTHYSPVSCRHVCMFNRVRSIAMCKIVISILNMSCIFFLLFFFFWWGGGQICLIIKWIWNTQLSTFNNFNILSLESRTSIIHMMNNIMVYLTTYVTCMKEKQMFW